MSMERSPCSGLRLNLYLLFVFPMIPKHSPDAGLSVLMFRTNEQISWKNERLFPSFGSLVVSSVIDIDLLRCLVCRSCRFSFSDPCLDRLVRDALWLDRCVNKVPS
jgi:hypothetical protein